MPRACGIENANGRLRRWLPRHLDIDRTSDQEIQEIVLTTNLTPRKCLGFKTPFQASIAELGKDVQIRFGGGGAGEGRSKKHGGRGRQVRRRLRVAHQRRSLAARSDALLQEAVAGGAGVPNVEGCARRRAPQCAADLASLRAAEPPFDVDPPVPNGTAALARRENTPPMPPAAAPPIAKSP
jgi:hypothetical protein